MALSRRRLKKCIRLGLRDARAARAQAGFLALDAARKKRMHDEYGIGPARDKKETP